MFLPFCLVLAEGQREQIWSVPIEVPTHELPEKGHKEIRVLLSQLSQVVL
uniref:Uncharacterized protein n=1 Tax=Siphoviridae sp. ctgmM3 TaxID=2827912 RepID=A0A8S5TJX8_9CAUD|nr:MAG TPA: hypothetical protein [Siphoviridae sp. ctgmM3]